MNASDDRYMELFEREVRALEKIARSVADLAEVVTTLRYRLDDVMGDVMGEEPNAEPMGYVRTGDILGGKK
jgi:hypothetical protein